MTALRVEEQARKIEQLREICHKYAERLALTNEREADLRKRMIEEEARAISAEARVAELEAEVERLREQREAVRSELVNVQPHIAQGLERGDQCALFIDAHIDVALGVIGGATGKKFP